MQNQAFGAQWKTGRVEKNGLAGSNVINQRPKTKKLSRGVGVYPVIFDILRLISLPGIFYHQLME